MFSANDRMVTEYLNNCLEASEIFLVLIHIIGGAPARTAEIETYKLENLADQLRNVFVHSGQLILTAFHNKTHNLSSGDTSIGRFLDRETSRLLLAFLLIIKPFQVALVGAKFGTKEAASQALYLFAHNAVSFNYAVIRATITKKLAVSHISLNVSQYRHWQCEIVRLFASENPGRMLLQGYGPEREDYYTFTNVPAVAGLSSEAVSGEVEDALHTQAGHSVRTADRVYARNIQTFRGVSSTRLTNCQRASHTWQQILGFSND